MSAVVTGAVVGALIASSASHGSASAPMTPGQAAGLLVMLAISVVLGLVWVYLRRNDWYDKNHKVTVFIIGSVGALLGQVLLLGLAALVLTAMGY